MASGVIADDINSSIDSEGDYPVEDFNLNDQLSVPVTPKRTRSQKPTLAGLYEPPKRKRAVPILFSSRQTNSEEINPPNNNLAPILNPEEAALAAQNDEIDNDIEFLSLSPFNDSRREVTTSPTNNDPFFPLNSTQRQSPNPFINTSSHTPSPILNPEATTSELVKTSEDSASYVTVESSPLPSIPEDPNEGGILTITSSGTEVKDSDTSVPSSLPPSFLSASRQKISKRFAELRIRRQERMNAQAKNDKANPSKGKAPSSPYPHLRTKLPATQASGQAPTKSAAGVTESFVEGVRRRSKKFQETVEVFNQVIRKQFEKSQQDLNLSEPKPKSPPPARPPQLPTTAVVTTDKASETNKPGTSTAPLYPTCTCELSVVSRSNTDFCLSCSQLIPAGKTVRPADQYCFCTHPLKRTINEQICRRCGNLSPAGEHFDKYEEEINEATQKTPELCQCVRALVKHAADAHCIRCKKAVGTDKLRNLNRTLPTAPIFEYCLCDRAIKAGATLTHCDTCKQQVPVGKPFDIAEPKTPVPPPPNRNEYCQCPIPLVKAYGHIGCVRCNKPLWFNQPFETLLRSEVPPIPLRQTCGCTTALKTKKEDDKCKRCLRSIPPTKPFEIEATALAYCACNESVLANEHHPCQACGKWVNPEDFGEKSIRYTVCKCKPSRVYTYEDSHCADCNLPIPEGSVPEPKEPCCCTKAVIQEKQSSGICILCTLLISKNKPRHTRIETSSVPECLFHVKDFTYSKECNICQEPISAELSVKTKGKAFYTENSCVCPFATKERHYSQGCSSCKKHITVFGHISAKVKGRCYCAKPAKSNLQNVYCITCAGTLPFYCCCPLASRELPSAQFCHGCCRSIHPDRSAANEAKFCSCSTPYKETDTSKDCTECSKPILATFLSRVATKPNTRLSKKKAEVEEQTTKGDHIDKSLQKIDKVELDAKSLQNQTAKVKSDNTPLRYQHPTSETSGQNKLESPLNVTFTDPTKDIMSAADKLAIKGLVAKIMEDFACSREDAKKQATRQWQAICGQIGTSYHPHSSDDDQDDENEEEDHHQKKKKYNKKDNDEASARKDKDEGRRSDKALLKEVTRFTGERERFDSWLRDFLNAVQVENFSDAELVRMFRSKLCNNASVTFTNLETSSPKDAKVFAKVTQYFHERYHGFETKEEFRRVFNKCSQKPDENVQSFCSRLETHFNYAYPTISGSTEDSRLVQRDRLKERFVEGLETKLQEKLRTAIAMKAENYEDMELNELVRLASRLSMEVQGKERKIFEFTKAIKEELKAEIRGGAFDGMIRPSSSSISAITQTDPRGDLAAKLDRTLAKIEEMASSQRQNSRPDIGSITCYNCQEKGHYSNRCDKPKRLQSSQLRQEQQDPYCRDCRRRHRGQCQPQSQPRKIRPCRHCDGNHYDNSCPNFNRRRNDAPGNQNYQGGTWIRSTPQPPQDVRYQSQPHPDQSSSQQGQPEPGTSNSLNAQENR